MNLRDLKDKIKRLETTHVEYRSVNEVLQALQLTEDSAPGGILTHVAGIQVRFTKDEGITALTRHCKELSDKIYDLCDELRLDITEFTLPGDPNAE